MSVNPSELDPAEVRQFADDFGMPLEDARDALAIGKGVSPGCVVDED